MTKEEIIDYGFSPVDLDEIKKEILGMGFPFPMKNKSVFSIFFNEFHLPFFLTVELNEGKPFKRVPVVISAGDVDVFSGRLQNINEIIDIISTRIDELEKSYYGDFKYMKWDLED